MANTRGGRGTQKIKEATHESLVRSGKDRTHVEAIAAQTRRIRDQRKQSEPQHWMQFILRGISERDMS